ncbi:MAG: serine hydrolase domain-containing protein [Candidatus Hodarchaeota archaeon]
MYRKSHFFFFCLFNFLLIPSFLIVHPLGFNSHKVTLITHLPENTSLDEQIIDLMEIGGIPSLAAAIIQKDNISWIKGFGDQAELNVNYPIGSITKSFIATGLLQLYEKDLFKLDDDINDYLPFNVRNPNFPETKITYQMLLTHTSSLQASTDTYWEINLQDWLFRLDALNLSYSQGAWGELNLANIAPNWEPYNFSSFVREYILPEGELYSSDVWGTWVPGTQMVYANAGFDLLALIVENLSNQTISQYLKENVFSPLNMTHTGFDIENFDESTLAIPHNYFEGNIYSGPPYNALAYGAGALRTSAADLARYFCAHMNHGAYNGIRILQEATCELMHGKYAESSEGRQWGLGWVHNPRHNPIQGHTGHTLGGVSIMNFAYWNEYPDYPYGIILLINQDTPDWPSHKSLIRLLFEEAASITAGVFQPMKVIITQPADSTIAEGNQSIVWRVVAPGLNWQLEFCIYFSSDRVSWQKIVDIPAADNLTGISGGEYEWDTHTVSDGQYWIKIDMTSGGITVSNISEGFQIMNNGDITSSTSSNGNITSSTSSKSTPQSILGCIVTVITCGFVRKRKRLTIAKFRRQFR